MADLTDSPPLSPPGPSSLVQTVGQPPAADAELDAAIAFQSNPKSDSLLVPGSRSSLLLLESDNPYLFRHLPTLPLRTLTLFVTSHAYEDSPLAPQQQSVLFPLLLQLPKLSISGLFIVDGKVF